MSTPASPSFKIIGGDGKEYGPIDLATLQQWAREGRLVRDSKVWDSRTGGWLQGGDISDLAAAFGSASTQPPATTPAIPAPLAPSSTLTATTQTNVLAIWSLVLSLLGFCCTLLPIAGIVCGIVALSQIKARREDGRGMAIAGIVIGVLMLMLSLLGLAVCLACAAVQIVVH